eukprot:3937678-Rhodomonas_salina.1
MRGEEAEEAEEAESAAMSAPATASNTSPLSPTSPCQSTPARETEWPKKAAAKSNSAQEKGLIWGAPGRAGGRG